MKPTVFGQSMSEPSPCPTSETTEPGVEHPYAWTSRNVQLVEHKASGLHLRLVLGGFPISVNRYRLGVLVWRSHFSGFEK